ncbi:P63C domain-containing protein [Mixta calida]|uniref:P63C domain-containing protein n=1 Tax=Mixta calida TaxID=665913 RepID=UPI0029159EE1|nr:P63C domain-containing protein [Mixta calida]MDU4288315.1 P63C domain-containing protein [Mixta calida]
MSDDKKEPKGKAKGGVARAKSLTKEQRSEIAKKGAAARWKDKPLKATHKGNFLNEFGIDAECYVLDNEAKTAVVTKTGLAKLIGLGERVKDIDRVLSAQYMTKYVGAVLHEKMEKPYIFQWENDGAVLGSFTGAHGYDISVVIDICKALTAAKDNGDLPESRMKAAIQAQDLVNSAAKVGITNVAYAVAGFKPEVQQVIDLFKAFVREEARQYEKEFPNELYEAWYKIYQLNKPDRGRPFLFKKLTIEQIYKPLAKSEGKILDLAKSSKDEFGKPGDKIHQFLSEVGVKALKQHIGKVLAVATLFEEKEAYEAGLEKVFK